MDYEINSKHFRLVTSVPPRYSHLPEFIAFGAGGLKILLSYHKAIVPCPA